MEDMGRSKCVEVRADLVGPGLAWLDRSDKIQQPDKNLNWRILQGLEYMNFQNGSNDPICTIYPFAYGNGIYIAGELVQEYARGVATGRFYRIKEVIYPPGSVVKGDEVDSIPTPFAVPGGDEYVCMSKKRLKSFTYILQPIPPKCPFLGSPYEISESEVNKNWLVKIHDDTHDVAEEVVSHPADDLTEEQVHTK